MIPARLFERPSVRADASPVGSGDGASRSTNETLQQDLFNTWVPRLRRGDREWGLRPQAPPPPCGLPRCARDMHLGRTRAGGSGLWTQAPFAVATPCACLVGVDEATPGVPRWLTASVARSPQARAARLARSHACNHARSHSHLLPAPAQDRRTQGRAAAFHASRVARSPMDH